MKVHNPDTRHPVISFDLAPHNAIGLIQTTFDGLDGTGYGTAFLIGAGRLATAGHVLWENPGNQLAGPTMAASATILLGPGILPEHPELVFDVGPDRFRVHPAFERGDGTRDIATISLEAAVPQSALSILPFPADLKVGEELTISGYPVDIEPFGYQEGTGSLSNTTLPLFEHEVDTCRGQSGAPIRVLRSGSWQTVGIHLGDARSLPGGAKLNLGLALTREMIAWLHAE